MRNRKQHNLSENIVIIYQSSIELKTTTYFSHKKVFLPKRFWYFLPIAIPIFEFFEYWYGYDFLNWYRYRYISVSVKSIGLSLWEKKMFLERRSCSCWLNMITWSYQSLEGEFFYQRMKKSFNGSGKNICLWAGNVYFETSKAVISVCILANFQKYCWLVVHLLLTDMGFTNVSTIFRSDKF